MLVNDFGALAQGTVLIAPDSWRAKPSGLTRAHHYELCDLGHPTNTRIGDTWLDVAGRELVVLSQPSRGRAHFSEDGDNVVIEAGVLGEDARWQEGRDASIRIRMGAGDIFSDAAVTPPRVKLDDEGRPVMLARRHEFA